MNRKQARDGADSVRRTFDALEINNKRELVSLSADLSESPARRAAACALIGQLRIREAVPTLIKVVEDKANEVSWAASKALGSVGSAVGVRPLCRIARQSSSFVARQGSIIALGRIGSPKAEPALIKILQNRKENSYIRGLAAQSLGELHPAKRAIPQLIRALQDPETEVRFSAICGLSTTTDKEAIAAIEELLDDDAEIPGEGKVSDLARVVLESMKERLLSKRRKRASRAHKPTRRT